MPLTLFGFLIWALAVCRAMQLVLHDRILQRPRRWWARRFNPQGRRPGDPQLGYLGYLYQCAWCASTQLALWSGLVLWAVTDRASAHLVWWFPAALAVSLLAVVFDRSVDQWWPDPPGPPPAPPAAPAPVPPHVAAAFAALETQPGPDPTAPR